MAVPTSTAHLTCLCGAVNEPGTLLRNETFPIDPPEICHCHPCCQTTGSLGSSFAVLKQKPNQNNLDACTPYASSETHTRYFCSKCGTPTFVEVTSRGLWYCVAGMIERDPEQVKQSDEWAKDVVQVKYHKWVSDTGDGGIAAKMRRLGGRDVPCYKGWQSDYKELKGKKAETFSIDEMRKMAENAENDKLPEKEELMEVRCHCGGVDLRVKRADFSKEKSDLKEKWTEAGDRYIAQFCACRSCRLQSGVSLQPWTYIPPSNFTVASTGKEAVFGRPGCEKGANEGTTLAHYWSSEDVCRSFCGRCGASLFYWCDDRPAVVDLSIGVIRAKGIMAMDWVSWRWRVSWEEECVDNEMREAILGQG